MWEARWPHLQTEQSWGQFLKAPELFRPIKPFFSSYLSKNGKVYVPETSCMKRTFVHIKNICIPLFNRKVPDFAMT